MIPMLARTYGPRYDTFPCYCQPKLNGVRALFQSETFQSRDEKLWKPGMLQHLISELDHLELGSLVLDGELYCHGWRLQRINGAIAVNRLEPSADTGHINFHVFDVVDPSRPFSSRWFDIYNTLKDANLDHIRAVPTALCCNREEVELHFHMYTRLGYEGIMLRPDGPYEFGEHMARHGQNMTSYRSKFLWKHKQFEDDEFEIIGITDGDGKASIGIGALVLKAKTGVEFKVGTGFDDETRIEYLQNPPIGKLAKVKYLCLTENGTPFNPAFITLM